MTRPAALLPALAALALVPLAGAHGAGTVLSGTDGDSEIVLEIDGPRLVSYSLEAGGTAVSPSDPRFKEKGDGFYMVDRGSGLLVIGKNPGGGDKWIIVSKLRTDSGTVANRYVVDAERQAPAGQRDLLAEMMAQAADEAPADDSFKAAQIAQKAGMLAEADRLRAEQLERAREAGGQTRSQSDSIRQSYEEYKLTEHDRDAEREKRRAAAAPGGGTESLQAFLSVPDRIEWRDALEYDVLVTDGSRHRFDSEFGEFVGNGSGNAGVSVKITGPDGAVAHRSDGDADSGGRYSGSFIIPDRSNTRGEWKLEAVATGASGGSRLSATVGGGFFVVPIDGGSFNNPPTAVITLPSDTQELHVQIPPGDGMLDAAMGMIQLDGSGSSDVEGSALTYSWNVTGMAGGSPQVEFGVMNPNVALSARVDNSAGNDPTVEKTGSGFDIKRKSGDGSNVREDITFKIDLIVSDGLKDSAPDSKEITVGIVVCEGTEDEKTEYKMCPQ